MCQARNVSCTGCVSGQQIGGTTVTIQCKSSDESICTTCNVTCDGCNVGCQTCDVTNGCTEYNTETCINCFTKENSVGTNCDGSTCNSKNCYITVSCDTCNNWEKDC